MILIDCHTHTERYSGCSHVPPDTLCDLAARRGLHGIAITEHHQWWPPAELDLLRERHPNIHIYAGAEITVAEGFDVVCLGPPPDCDPDLLYRPALADLFDMLAPWRERMYLFSAHPFRFQDDTPPALREILTRVDGLEANSLNIMKYRVVCEDGRYNPDNRDLYDRAAAEYGLLPLFNTDTHHAPMPGCVANRFDLPAPPKDTAALVALLHGGPTPAEHQDAPRIERFLAGLQSRI